MPKSRRRAPRPRKRIPMLRWAALATLAVVTLLYYRPVKSYIETRRSLEQNQAEVRDLRAKRNELARRLAASDTPEALARRARKLGLVKPGEQLFIIKGIPEWRARVQAKVTP